MNILEGITGKKNAPYVKEAFGVSVIIEYDSPDLAREVGGGGDH